VPAQLGEENVSVVGQLAGDDTAEKPTQALAHHGTRGDPACMHISPVHGKIGHAKTSPPERSRP